MKKRGQITMTWIIMAAIALVTLVIIIAIFTGQSDKFVKSLNEEAGITLSKLKQNYGSCHPNTAAEIAFSKAYADAADETQRQQITNDFDRAIETCKQYSSDRCSFQNYQGDVLKNIACRAD